MTPPIKDLLPRLTPILRNRLGFSVPVVSPLVNGNRIVSLCHLHSSVLGWAVTHSNHYNWLCHWNVVCYNFIILINSFIWCLSWSCLSTIVYVSVSFSWSKVDLVLVLLSKL